MLNKKLNEIHNNLEKYIVYNQLPPLTGYDIENWVLDIEVCPVNEDKDEVLVYSIAIMSCDKSYICYKYNDLEKCLNDLMNIDSKLVNIYIHNLFYDIKPFIIKLFEKIGNNPICKGYYEKEEYNKFTKETEKIQVENNNFSHLTRTGEYICIMNKGSMYQFTLGGKEIVRKFKKKERTIISNVVFKDTLKIMPFTLQKCCDEFINLQLPKDGLDYEKIRKAEDELTREELIYIYNDVYGLSNLVRKMCIEGEDINGRHITMDKLTSSSQALADYKHTITQDFLNHANAFENENLWEEVDNKLFSTKFYDNIAENKKEDILFRALYPQLTFAEHSFIKHSYFGGLCCVDFDNVKKFEQIGDKTGVVLDVNSLYPSMMSTKLLPYGRGFYSLLPYNKMGEDFKKEYPLYFQEIIIHDMKVKKNKMHWVQVKDRIDFNGRQVLKENINLDGQKVSIRLVLSNVLLELLFECYDVNSYQLGCSISYKGSYKLFENYISFWSEVKKNNTGSKRANAKLKLNGLYGKFGSSANAEITNLFTENNIFGVEHTKLYYVRESVYIPMASFITSYAKEFLVNAINKNRQSFMYCDTDSIHLRCKIEEVKGVKIHDKDFCCWCHEMTFNDFKYIGAKRYAEKNGDKWEIKCCGLTDKIMQQVDDIEIFDYCEFTSKELQKVKLYTKDDVYYYKDKECTQRVKGLIKSKKARQVKNGTLIVESPYMIN